jgi:phospholipase A1
MADVLGTGARRTWVAAALIAACRAVQAQQPIDPSDCPRIAEDGERLACYDRQAGRGADAMPAAATATAAAPAIEKSPPASPLSAEWELTDADKRGTFNFEAYHPTYFLPIRAMKSVNQFPASPTRGAAPTLPHYQHVETELQLSMRTKLLEDAFPPGADLWLAYTQQSMWQLWNHAESAPFRTTDYQPELIFVVPTPQFLQRLPLGWRWRMSQVGLVHQSNGQTRPLSRGWNRVYGRFALENGSVTFAVRAEQRIDTSNGPADDNPDIVHYLSHGETELTWSPGLATTLLNWRPSLSGRGSVRLRWTYPLNGDHPEGARWYLTAFHGYGETLLDYNFRQSSLGVGLAVFRL